MLYISCAQAHYFGKYFVFCPDESKLNYSSLLGRFFKPDLAIAIPKYNCEESHSHTLGGIFPRR